MRKLFCNLETNNMDYHSDAYDNAEGNFDAGRLEDAILDGEYVPDDW